NDAKPYIPKLAALIGPKTHSQTVLGILRCFSAFPSEKASFVPSLVTVMNDTRSELSLGVLDLIYELKIADVQLLPKVKANLASKDLAIKVRATEVLGLFGEAAVAEGPLLIKGFRDPNKSYRQACSSTLSKLGAKHPSLATLVAKELQSKEWLVRAYGARCLGNMGSAGSVGLDALKTCVEDPDARVRWSAVKALGQMGDKSAGAVPELISALLDEDEDVVLVAIVTLGKIGVKARKAIPTLKKIKKIASKEQLRAIEESLKALEAN
ncbi:MAG: HEAT repeat domain-containing protein, partial [Planctomycetota bacterium]|nr:HEAT repeat domain-containing protein [Planctomycetota bacterium]